MIKEVSYGIIPIRGEEVLLLKSYNNYDFPKGGPDSGETPVQTACREMQEESGLINPQFNWGLEYAETVPYKKGKKIARYFLAECPTGDVVLLENPESGKVEHHAWAWLSFTEARLRLNARLQPILDWACAQMSIKDG